MLIVVAVLGGVFLGLVWVVLNWRSYDATARVVLSDPWEADLTVTDNPVGGDFDRFVRNQAGFMGSSQVLELAAVDLGLALDDLEPTVSSSAGSSGYGVVLTVSASNASDAETRRDAVLAAYSRAREALLVEQLQAELASIEAQQDTANGAFDATLDERKTRISIAVAAYGDGVSFVERDRAEAALGLISRLAYPVLGGLAGLALGLVAAWMLADRRPTLLDATDVIGRHGMIHLGTVPQVDRELTDDPDLRAEFEIAMLALANLLRSHDPRTGGRAYGVVMTSAERESGVTATARLLAQAAIGNGARAEVIDADIRSVGRGLDPRVVDRALRDHGVILFDCAPPHVDSTALRLGMDLDAVVLVLKHGCDLREVDHAVRMFETVGVEPSGFVMTTPTRETRRRRRR